MPLNQIKLTFITNLCSRYTIKPFELIARKYYTEFYFTGGHEAYWEKKNKVYLGDFQGHYISGLRIGKHFKISWRLFSLLWSPWDFMIKTLDDRFALPMCFTTAKIRRKPFILWTGLWHHPQTVFHKATFLFTKLIYRNSDAIIVYGKHIKQYLVSLGINQEKIFCAPHALESSYFNGIVSEGERSQIKSELKISNEKILLYVGRLEPCKGLEFLIDAVAKIKNVKCAVLFIGNGSQREPLQIKCQQLNVNAKFLEYIPNDRLCRYYALADVFILPSVTTNNFKEPWGMVINEAMNQGCPIIATDAVGAAAGGLVEDGKNGFIVQEKNSEVLASAIRKIVMDDVLRQRMSADSRDRIKNWTPENMAQGFFDAIEYVQRKGAKHASRKCYAQ